MYPFATAKLCAENPKRLIYGYAHFQCKSAEGLKGRGFLLSDPRRRPFRIIRIAESVHKAFKRFGTVFAYLFLIPFES